MKDDDFQFYRKFVDISNSLKSKGQGEREVPLPSAAPPPPNGYKNFISWQQKKNVFPGNIGRFLCAKRVCKADKKKEENLEKNGKKQKL